MGANGSGQPGLDQWLGRLVRVQALGFLTQVEPRVKIFAHLIIGHNLNLLIESRRQAWPNPNRYCLYLLTYLPKHEIESRANLIDSMVGLGPDMIEAGRFGPRTYGPCRA